MIRSTSETVSTIPTLDDEEEEEEEVEEDGEGPCWQAETPEDEEHGAWILRELFSCCLGSKSLTAVELP